MPGDLSKQGSPEEVKHLPDRQQKYRQYQPSGMLRPEQHGAQPLASDPIISTSWADRMVTPLAQVQNLLSGTWPLKVNPLLFFANGRAAMAGGTGKKLQSADRDDSSTAPCSALQLLQARIRRLVPPFQHPSKHS